MYIGISISISTYVSESDRNWEKVDQCISRNKINSTCAADPVKPTFRLVQPGGQTIKAKSHEKRKDNREKVNRKSVSEEIQ